MSARWPSVRFIGVVAIFLRVTAASQATIQAQAQPAATPPAAGSAAAAPADAPPAKPPLKQEELDQLLAPIERWFAYMPLEHAEDLAVQDESVRLFESLAAAWPQQFGSAFDYALRHRDVIRRFGRFPHRNAVLGRPCTAEELAYLENAERYGQ